jgi:hypothetical protein
MPVRVTIPIRLRVDPEALTERQADLEEALAAAVGRALVNSRDVVLEPRGGYVGLRIHPPEFSWYGNGLETAITINRHEIEEQITNILRQSVESAGILELARIGEQAQQPLLAESVESLDRDRATTELTSYTLPSYDNARDVVLPVVATAPDREAERREEEAVEQQKMAALRNISSRLSTDILDWFVTDDDARSVLRTLQRLSPEVLLRTIQIMRLSGAWRTFVSELPESDLLALSTLTINLDPDIGYIMPGDDIRVEVYASGQLQSDFSFEYNVYREGVRVVFIPQPIRITSLLPVDAANAIAHAYVEALIFTNPRVRLMVTRRGYLYAPHHGLTHQTFWFDSTYRAAVDPAEKRRRQKRSEFIYYIRSATSTDSLTVNASIHYLNWVERNYLNPDFLTRTPADLWRWALTQASTPPPSSPLEPFLSLMRSRYNLLDSASAQERPRLQGTLNRFIAWVDAHRNDPNLSRHDPVEIWGQMYRLTLEQERRQWEDSYRQRAVESPQDSPETQRLRTAKFQEFYNLALQLWGYSSRRFPYTIPVRAEGRDILVTGDPARQQVLNDLARDLMNWAVAHMYLPNYLSSSPIVVLAGLLPNHEERLRQSSLAPLQSESIARHDIDPERALAAFGETVATGLLVIGLVGAAVGAGIISAPTAGLLLLLVAGYSGIRAYLDRREEIERVRADVPIPETMLASVGDVVGLSQLIEGITGERLSTGRRLDSLERSDALGGGAGGVTLLLVGSRIYRAGQLRGQRLQLSLPGRVPPGPEGRAPVLGAGETLPPLPEASPNPGPLEAALRTGLPQELRMGFDGWMAEIRQNGGNPETVLGRMSEAARRQVAQRQAERRVGEFREEIRREYARQRAADNPLNPIMRNVRRVGDIIVRYNEQMPGEHEIAQAQEIFNRTREPIELFGDTASGNQYRGIDGIIGNPPRTLSLKHGGVEAHANYARFAAEQAYQAAQTHGYSHVEVHIRMEGKTVAEIRAAWDMPPPQATQQAGGTVFDAAGTIARYIIQGTDGVWVVEPPLSGPPLTGTGLPRRDEDDRRRRDR